MPGRPAKYVSWSSITQPRARAQAGPERPFALPDLFAVIVIVEQIQ